MDNAVVPSSHVKNLKDQPFGQLTVLHFAYIRQGNAYWSCQCSCGKIRIIAAHSLKRGMSKSCGCSRYLYDDGIYKRSEYPDEHRIFRAMWRRCTNPNTRDYDNYGGRGITVDPRWRSFDQFLLDMGPRPSSHHSLDRIDTNGSYCSDNCRWVTMTAQMRNKRNNHLLSLSGITKTLVEWAEITGVRQETIRRRLSRGWSVEHALTVLPAQQARD